VIFDVLFHNYNINNKRSQMEVFLHVAAPEENLKKTIILNSKG